MVTNLTPKASVFAELVIKRLENQSEMNQLYLPYPDLWPYVNSFIGYFIIVFASSSWRLTLSHVHMWLHFTAAK